MARVLLSINKDDRRAETLVKEGLAAKPGDAGLTGLLAGLHNGAVSGGGAPSPPQTTFTSPLEAADSALAMLADRNQGGAESVFQMRNFPQRKQPLAVRQAYAEVSLQSLLGAAHPGGCAAVAARIDNFAPQNRNLPFTLDGFGDIDRQLRMQFYFGLAESLCGDTQTAQRRWSRIAKVKAPPTSADFAFAVLASSLVDPAGSQRIVETALETVRSGGGPSGKGVRLYVEGMILRAAGRDQEAAARFREGAAEPGAYTHYLNASAQSDPPLPR